MALERQTAPNRKLKYVVSSVSDTLHFTSIWVGESSTNALQLQRYSNHRGRDGHIKALKPLNRLTPRGNRSSSRARRAPPVVDLEHALRN